MDSLFANYAVSDDEDEQQEPPPTQPLSNSSASRSDDGESPSSRSSPLFSTLPPPKSSSLFQSLPRPSQSSKPSFPTDLFDNNDNDEAVEEDLKSTSNSVKSSSIFSSLPRPKGNLSDPLPSSTSPLIDGGRDGKPANSTSIFPSLPTPNSQKLQQPNSNLSSSQPKRVVLFKPPVNPSSLNLSEDEDDEDEDAERRRRKASESSFQTPSVTSFLSSIPAPKNSSTLGVLPSSGLGRRSIVETDVPVSASGDSYMANDSGFTQNIDTRSTNYDSLVNYSSGVDQNVDNHRENDDNLGTEKNAWNYVNYDGYGNYQYTVDQNVDGEAQSGLSASNAEYGSYENYGNYGDYGQYGNNSAGPSAMVNTETYAIAENAVRIPEKKRRNEIPSEILEVKQDELIKNRPREDQVKLTGIAFGPSYQPASTKGKPSKLHKRKHQINSLYFDMKQKEMELAERRARGLLTKAETQAKYGW